MTTAFFAITGWTPVVDTLCGPMVMLEGDKPEDAEPIFYASAQEAAADWRLESDEALLFAGMTEAGDVFELEESTLEVLRPLRRSDR